MNMEDVMKAPPGGDRGGADERTSQGSDTPE